MNRYRTPVASDLIDGDWRDRAACAGLASRELDPWHPNDDWPKRDQRAAYELAREVCDTCPVLEQCRAFGLAMLPLLGPHNVGMFGGLTPGELVAQARDEGLPARKVAQHGTRARRVAGCDCDDCKRAHTRYIAERRADEALAGPPPRACDARTNQGSWCEQTAHPDSGLCTQHEAMIPDPNLVDFDDGDPVSAA